MQESKCCRMKTIKAINYGKNEISLVSGLRQNGMFHLATH